jgi:hypothetical protein
VSTRCQRIPGCWDSAAEMPSPVQSASVNARPLPPSKLSASVAPLASMLGSTGALPEFNVAAWRSASRRTAVSLPSCSKTVASNP